MYSVAVMFQSCFLCSLGKAVKKCVLKPHVEAVVFHQADLVRVVDVDQLLDVPDI